MNTRTDMQAKEKSVSFGLRISNIKILRYTQSELIKDFDPSADPLISFDTNFSLKVIKDKEQIACLVGVKLIVKETSEEFAEINIEYLFDVKEFNAVIIPIEGKDGQYNILDDLIENIISISTSTTRGILFEKLRGTIVQKDIFPLLNLAHFKESKQ